MLERIFSIGLDLLAFVTPISIAATNIVFFPLAALWFLGGHRTLSKWAPAWGLAEKIFLVYLGVSFLSALLGVDVYHSLREIKNKDFYILIAIVLVALVRQKDKNAHLLEIFMQAGLLTALWGLIQFCTGVNQSDKSNGFFYALPAPLAHWPRRLLDLLSMVNGRVIGTRSHPLNYAECLLFNWAFGIYFVLYTEGRLRLKWIAYMGFVGAALLVSQSRGPWIAAGVMVLVAALTSRSKGSWLLLGMTVLFLGVFVAVPSLHKRAASITDSSHHSNRDRLDMWKAGWSLWRDNPFLGVGPGNVKRVSPPFQTEKDRRLGPWGHLHSIYMNGLAERGALGLFGLLALIGAFCHEFWLAWRRSKSMYERVVFQSTLLGVLGFLIGGLTETSYNTAVVMMTFYFVVGLALALARHEQTD